MRNGSQSRYNLKVPGQEGKYAPVSGSSYPGSGVHDIGSDGRDCLHYTLRRLSLPSLAVCCGREWERAIETRLIEVACPLTEAQTIGFRSIQPTSDGECVCIQCFKRTSHHPSPETRPSSTRPARVVPKLPTLRHGMRLMCGGLVLPIRVPILIRRRVAGSVQSSLTSVRTLIPLVPLIYPPFVRLVSSLSLFSFFPIAIRT